jgi:hypothetical protein
VLTGKDVPGKFLEQEGAHVIKKLVGHDLLSAEKKGSNADIPFIGNFGVGITCNSRMRVRLDGDLEAMAAAAHCGRVQWPQIRKENR